MRPNGKSCARGGIAGPGDSMSRRTVAVVDRADGEQLDPHGRADPYPLTVLLNRLEWVTARVDAAWWPVGWSPDSRQYFNDPVLHLIRKGDQPLNRSLTEVDPDTDRCAVSRRQPSARRVCLIEPYFVPNLRFELGRIRQVTQHRPQRRCQLIHHVYIVHQPGISPRPGSGCHHDAPARPRVRPPDPDSALSAPAQVSRQGVQTTPGWPPTRPVRNGRTGPPRSDSTWPTDSEPLAACLRATC